MKKIFILAIILLSGTATASAQEFLTILSLIHISEPTRPY